MNTDEHISLVKKELLRLAKVEDEAEHDTMRFAAGNSVTPECFYESLIEAGNSPEEAALKTQWYNTYLMTG